MEATHEPKTLQEAFHDSAAPENCLNYLVARRPEWKNGVICPRCGSSSVGFLKNQMRWQCSNRHPKRQFSVKVGTIMEDSPIGLDKWLPAMWMLQNSKNGISSCEIARALGVTQKTAWFLLHRIRLAQQGKNSGKLSGHIEVDETFIGGKARNMHASKRAKNRPFEKAVVMGGSLKNTSAKDRTSIPTNCSPIGAWRISTPTKSSITRRHMWKARFTPTAWKTSGVC